MNMRSAVLPALLAVAMSLGLGACAGTKYSSDQPIPWTGLGVTMTLPPGTWRAKEVRPGMAVHFTQSGSPSQLALMRVEAEPDKAESLVLRELFLAFEEKQELARSAEALPSGRIVECVRVAVVMKRRDTEVTACALRIGSWVYELVEWDYTGEPVALRLARTLEPAGLSGESP